MAGTGLQAIMKADDPGYMTSASLAGGAALYPEQFTEYVRLIQNVPTMLKDITVQPMQRDILELGHLEVSGRVLSAAAEGVGTPADKMATMTASKGVLTAHKLRAVLPVTGEDRIRSLTQAGFDDYATMLLAEATARDAQALVLLGDTESADDLLKAFDGLLKKVSSHDLDYSGQSIKVTDDPFYEMWLAMPKRYRIAWGPKFRFYCSSNILAAYNKFISARQTLRGDIQIIDGVQTTFWEGKPLYPVSDMPDDTMMLTANSNCVLGILQTVRPFRWDCPLDDVTYYGNYQWMDTAFVEEDGVVVFRGLSAAASITS